MQAHILYFGWLEILGLVGNFELKTISSGEELWTEILCPPYPVVQLHPPPFPFPFLKANRKHCKQANVRTIQANLSDIQTNRSAI